MTTPRAAPPRRAAAPVAPAVPAAPAPTEPAAPAPRAPRAIPDPREDPRYTQSISALQGRITGKRAEYDLDAKRDQEDIDTTMARMAQARAKDLTGANSGANREGLFYSTVLTDRRKDIESDYGRREDDMRVSHRRRGEDREAALRSLGNVVADPNSPTGYSATGSAGEDLLRLYDEAIARRLRLDEGI